jgi:hypothetical protein
MFQILKNTNRLLKQLKWMSRLSFRLTQGLE